MAQPQPSPLVRLTVEALGARGEGVALVDGRKVFVPYAVPGDVVTAEVEGQRATLVGLVAASPDRVAPVCPHFTICGGCAVQAVASSAYALWKQGLVRAGLARAGLEADVAPLVDAHGEGRRRATFHARTLEDGSVRVGFMRARSHDIAAIATCPILTPGLDGALPAARAIAGILADMRKPLDIVATATESGLDIDLRGHGPLADASRAALVEIALAHDLARLCNHGRVVVETRKPMLTIGTARLVPPPGAFLQATIAGERVLADHVLAAVGSARKVVDLFAGVGTFALRLAARADVLAIDGEASALAALQRAAATPGLRQVDVETRDLVRRPLTAEILDRYDAVVVDPPRAGAAAQMRAIAASSAGLVVSVSCDVDSFSRDAKILIDAGFDMGPVIAIDQFRYSPHVELVATFTRVKRRTKRRLLG